MDVRETSLEKAKFILYRGRLFGEAVEHPLSGVNPQSFQPTIGSLADMLWAGGFSEISLLEKSMTPDGNGPAVLLKAEKNRTAVSS